MQKMITFYHEKDIDIVNLGCTLPNLANTSLHKSTEAKIYPFREGDKDLMEKVQKILLVVHLSLLHVKQSLTKLLFENPQTYANLLSGLMQANYTPTPCFSRWQRLFIRVGISIQKPVDSHLVRTRPVVLKTWSCPIFNEQNKNVQLEACKLQADRRKLTASVLMDSVLIPTLCSEQWTAFTTFVPVKKYVPL